ncbi:hypothetical protein HK096_003044, partial [Nowakowskiella sp. JEL0078]
LENTKVVEIEPRRETIRWHTVDFSEESVEESQEKSISKLQAIQPILEEQVQRLLDLEVAIKRSREIENRLLLDAKRCNIFNLKHGSQLLFTKDPQTDISFSSSVFNFSSTDFISEPTSLSKSEFTEQKTSIQEFGNVSTNSKSQDNKEEIIPTSKAALNKKPRLLRALSFSEEDIQTIDNECEDANKTLNQLHENMDSWIKNITVPGSSILQDNRKPGNPNMAVNPELEDIESQNTDVWFENTKESVGGSTILKPILKRKMNVIKLKSLQNENKIRENPSMIVDAVHENEIYNADIWFENIKKSDDGSPILKSILKLKSSQSESEVHEKPSMIVDPSQENELESELSRVKRFKYTERAVHNKKSHVNAEDCPNRRYVTEDPIIVSQNEVKQVTSPSMNIQSTDSEPFNANDVSKCDD